VIEFLLAGQNLPFAIAYGFVLIFGLVTFLGGAMDHHGHGDAHGHEFDHGPDVHAGHEVHGHEVHGHDVHGHDADGHDGHVHLDGNGVAETLLGWLGIGKAPLTMLLISFGWSFGSVGFVTQWIARKSGGALMPAILACAIALVPALVTHGFIARGLAVFTGKDDSTAVHSESFVGKTATVLLAASSKGKPTQAKFRDQHGQTHYILVEPHRDEDTFSPGDEVVLVSRNGSLFEAMPTDIDDLTERLRVGLTNES
jgi:hypothetical protein